MLRYLLDEHISPAVAAGVTALRRDIPIVALRDWAGGALGADDTALLRATSQEGLTLITYDLRTIPTLLFEWGQAETSHGGVILIDKRTIEPEDMGGLVHALVALWDARKNIDWRDRVAFLERCV